MCRFTAHWKQLSIPFRSAQQRGAALRPGHKHVRKTEEGKGVGGEFC